MHRLLGTANKTTTHEALHKGWFDVNCCVISTNNKINKMICKIQDTFHNLKTEVIGKQSNVAWNKQNLSCVPVCCVVLTKTHSLCYLRLAMRINQHNISTWTLIMAWESSLQFHKVMYSKPCVPSFVMISSGKQWKQQISPCRFRCYI